MTEAKAGKEQEEFHPAIHPPWASILAPICALALGAVGGSRILAGPQGIAGVPGKADSCPQKIQPTARFVLQALAGKTVSLSCA